jgi:hypothetical protein
LVYLCLGKNLLNACGEPPPEAGARNERTLWAAGSSAMLGPALALGA